jgi:hypothetical protein
VPSTVYKGDLTEVTFGHETGLTLEHGYAGSFKFTASFDPNIPAPANAPHQDTVKDTSVVVLSGGAPNTPVYGGILRYPNGMLVGSRVTFTIASSSPNWSALDDYAATGRQYTIIKQEVANDTSNQNDGKTEITLSPALRTDHSSADKDSKTSDVMRIHAFATPTIDVSMAHDDAANESCERVLTDQFVGLVSTVALPETKVDLKRFHVVGLGRDVAIQVPGRYTNTEGSFECNIHNGRWFYYCLGHEVVKPHDTTKNTGHASELYTLSSDVSAGDDYIQFTSLSGSTNAKIGGTDIRLGDYVILDTQNATVDVQTYRDTGVGTSALAKDNAWPAVGVDQIFDKAVNEEVRRVAAITQTAGDGKVWLDDPISYSHPTDTTTVTFASYEQISTTLATGYTEGATALVLTSSANFKTLGTGLIDGTEFVWTGNNTGTNTLTVADLGASYASGVSIQALHGSPHRALNGSIAYPVEHLFFSRTTVPSFAMEVSIRRRDINSNEGTMDGGAGDSKQLTRVFRGCKVKEFSLTADTDAALRLTVNFDSALCYTDTGRLEAANKGDRYDTHRLFEDTANTEVERKKAGIEKGTQKPFMFYNGTITVAGASLGQVVSFTLNGKTGVEQYYAINGASVVDSVTDQVPHAGTRNPKLAVEGKTEYDLEMEIIVDDPFLYHKMRRAVDHFDDVDEAAQTDADMIRLSFTKQGGATPLEQLDILIDDYFITEAPLPIPEDKGPIRSVLKILPKSMKVVSKDTILHA